jgi:hypothetical protein
MAAVGNQQEAFAPTVQDKNHLQAVPVRPQELSANNGPHGISELH